VQSTPFKDAFTHTRAPTPYLSHEFFVDFGRQRVVDQHIGAAFVGAKCPNAPGREQVPVVFGLI